MEDIVHFQHVSVVIGVGALTQSYFISATSERGCSGDDRIGKLQNHASNY